MKMNYKYLLVFSFIIFWILLGYFESIHLGKPDLLHFIHIVSWRRLDPHIKDKVLYGFFNLSILSGSILGVIYFNKNKIYMWLFIITLLVWLVGTNTFNALPNHNFWRISVEWIILLIPFVAYFIYKRKKYQIIFLLGFVCLFANQSITYSVNHKPDPVINLMTQDDINLGKKIQTLKGNFIMPRLGSAFINPLVTSQQPERITYVYDFKKVDLHKYNYLIYPNNIHVAMKEIYHNNKWYIFYLNKDLTKK